MYVERNDAVREPFNSYRKETRKLAALLSPTEVYGWLMDKGYFPETYVLPPCFHLSRRPQPPKLHFPPTCNGRLSGAKETECEQLFFPKSRYTDRTFSIMHPKVYSDIAWNLTSNWNKVVNRLIPRRSVVTSYSFPIPIDRINPGEIGARRGGRMIYQFLEMLDEDIATAAFRYPFVVRTDIRNFYPSIYTHAISWAFHGKQFIRQRSNRRDCRLIGNSLDRLFQCASDGRTNGIPVGPAVCDVTAEVIASAVDSMFSEYILQDRIDCQAIRFKDDYRVLVKSQDDGNKVIRHLQKAAKQFHLELGDDKTSVQPIPQNLFREWFARYMAVFPGNEALREWDAFWRLYMNVIQIEKEIPGSGMIDRFLSDLLEDNSRLRLALSSTNVMKLVSLLLMLRELRPQSFPKILAVIELVHDSTEHECVRSDIQNCLIELFESLAHDEERNCYFLVWLCYVLNSMGKVAHTSSLHGCADPILRTVAEDTRYVFVSVEREYNIFQKASKAKRRTTLLDHVDLFPREDVI
jgi:hypothetical protein